MSTNYYLQTEAQAKADQDGRHLGLSAAGIFMFRAYPKQNIISVKSLEAFLRQAEGTITNEVGETLTVDEFLEFVSIRRRPEMSQFKNSETVVERKAIREGMRFKDAEGYLFYNYEFS